MIEFEFVAACRRIEGSQELKSQSENLNISSKWFFSEYITVELPKFSISPLLWFLIAIKVRNWEPFEWFFCFFPNTRDHTSDCRSHLRTNCESIKLPFTIRDLREFWSSDIFSTLCFPNIDGFYEWTKIFFKTIAMADSSPGIKNMFSDFKFCRKPICGSFWWEIWKGHRYVMRY